MKPKYKIGQRVFKIHYNQCMEYEVKTQIIHQNKIEYALFLVTDGIREDKIWGQILEEELFFSRFYAINSLYTQEEKEIFLKPEFVNA